jgi:hypothetical protein
VRQTQLFVRQAQFMCDRSNFPYYRRNSLSLQTVIVLSNTVYLERATQALQGNEQAVDPELLKYLSPLGWEHINPDLTGDYLWRLSAKIRAGTTSAAAPAVRTATPST